MSAVRWAGAIVFAVLLGLAACSAPEPEEPRPEIELPTVTTEDLFVLVRKSEVVAVAEVLEVEAPPGRAGDERLDQWVRYRVAETLKGAEVPETLRAAHPVMRARPFVDEVEGGLSEAYFRPGGRFILFLERDAAGEYRVWNDRRGAILDGEGTRDAVRKAVRAAGGGGRRGDPFNR